MTTKTQTRLEQKFDTSQHLVKKQKTVIAVFGNHARGKTTAAILTAMGLAKLGKSVHFVNLDEAASIPLAVPYSQIPEIALLNCPDTADDSIIECAQVANICVIVSSPSPISINGATAVLEKISKYAPITNICILPTAIECQQQEKEVLKILMESSIAILNQLPAIPLHPAISHCTKSGYLEQDMIVARELVLPICEALIKIINS